MTSLEQRLREELRIRDLQLQDLRRQLLIASKEREARDTATAREDALRASLNEARAAVRRMKLHVDETSGESARFTGTIADLTARIQQLTAELERERRTAAGAEARVERIKNECYAKTSDITSELEREKSLKTAAVAAAAAAERQLAAMQKKAAEAAAAAASSANEAAERTRSDEETMSRLKAAEAAAAAAERRSAALKAEVAELRRALASARDENTVSNESASEARAACRGLEERVSVLERELHRCTRERDAGRLEIANMQAELESAQNEATVGVTTAQKLETVQHESHAAVLRLKRAMKQLEVDIPDTNNLLDTVEILQSALSQAAQDRRAALDRADTADSTAVVAREAAAAAAEARKVAESRQVAAEAAQMRAETAASAASASAEAAKRQLHLLEQAQSAQTSVITTVCDILHLTDSSSSLSSSDLSAQIKAALASQRRETEIQREAAQQAASAVTELRQKTVELEEQVTVSQEKLVNATNAARNAGSFALRLVRLYAAALDQITMLIGVQSLSSELASGLLMLWPSVRGLEHSGANALTTADGRRSEVVMQRQRQAVLQRVKAAMRAVAVGRRWLAIVRARRQAVSAAQGLSCRAKVALGGGGAIYTDPTPPLRPSDALPAAKMSGETLERLDEPHLTRALAPAAVLCHALMPYASAQDRLRRADEALDALAEMAVHAARDLATAPLRSPVGRGAGLLEDSIRTTTLVTADLDGSRPSAYTRF